MVRPIVYPQIRTSADVLKSTIRMEKLIPFLQQQKAEACAIVNSKLYGLLPFMACYKTGRYSCGRWVINTCAIC